MDALNRWAKLALLAAAAALAAELYLRAADGPPPSGGVPAPAPALVLPTLAGAPIDLRALRGKVVAVNFWASWCGPCLKELPDLAEVWRAQHGRCFELLGVAEMSGREDVERVAQGLPYPVLLDADATANDAWGVKAYPRTFLVDAEGRVRRVFRGAVGKGELTEALAPLLPPSCAGQGG